MRFIDGGPDVPEALLREHQSGNVIFVIGAGLSIPAGMPSFRQLVEQVYDELGLELPVDGSSAPFAEREAWKGFAYDRVLGLLERRIVYAKPSRPSRTNRMREVVARLLQSRDSVLPIQCDILDIVSDELGRPRLVTTNFDTLFEKAWSSTRHDGLLSLSGTALPPVGSSGFAGVMHIHGRIGDVELGLNAADLVLTSGDFGEAYLRSGWASRYIYDLLRRYTLVFIGYSAEDPPMRYMLDAIESGRVHFPDLHRAYAFAPLDDSNEGNVRELWRAKGLAPIVYQKIDNHKALYETLSAWAKSCREPLVWAGDRVASLTCKSLKDTPESDQLAVRFIIETMADTGVLSKAASSCDWIECLLQFPAGSSLVGSAMELTGITRLTDWLRDRLENARTTHWALDAKPYIQKLIADAVRWLMITGETQEPYAIFWRLYGDVHERALNRATGLTALSLKDRVAAGQIDHFVIRTVSEMLRPRLNMSRRWDSEKPQQDPVQLSDLCSLSFRCDDALHARELLDVWPSIADSEERLLSALDRTLADQCDYFRQLQHDDDVAQTFAHVEVVHPIDDKETRAYNRDFHDGRPRWRENEPDEHDDSFAPIVRAITKIWNRLSKSAPERAAHFAEQWFLRRQIIFRRIGMWAATASGQRLFDLAVGELEQIDRRTFWLDARNPEYARFWCQRWNEISHGAREALETAILLGPESDWLLFAQGNEEKAEEIRHFTVYRELARIVAAGGRISEAAKSALDDARASDKSLPEKFAPIEGLYSISWSGWGPNGDASLVKDVSSTGLMEAVESLERSDPHNQSGLWDDLCASRPEDAWTALKEASSKGGWDGRKWSTFLSYRISREPPDQARWPTYEDALALLLLMPEAPFAVALRTVASFLQMACRRSEVSEARGQLLSLFDRIVEQLQGSELDREELSGDTQIQSINRPSGQMAGAIVGFLRNSDLSQPKLGIEVDLKSRLERLIKLPGRMRDVVLHVLCSELHLLHYIDPAWTEDNLLALIDNDGALARSLLQSWTVYDETRIIPIFDRLMQRIETALLDDETEGRFRDHLARVITWASFVAIAGKDAIALRPRDARRMFSRCSSKCLQSVARSLRHVHSDESHSNLAQIWETSIQPFFDKVWPIDVETFDGEVSSSLIQLPSAYGAAFPQAVDTVVELIVPTKIYSIFYGLYLNDDNGVFIEKYPSAALRLVFESVDPHEPAPYDLSNFLQKLSDADPLLKKDWRYRRLTALLRQ